jgi:REP element-mobilizing transposase RayT
MTVPAPLEHGHVYHIYSRGNNRENLFVEERNYRYFLALYARHVEPVADTFAYCLLPNHFHFLVRVQDLSGPPLTGQKKPSQHFSNLFNAYTKAFNKVYGRSGALFQRPFGRVPVTSDAYFPPGDLHPPQPREAWPDRRLSRLALFFVPGASLGPGDAPAAGRGPGLVRRPGGVRGGAPAGDRPGLGRAVGAGRF